MLRGGNEGGWRWRGCGDGGVGDGEVEMEGVETEGGGGIKEVKIEEDKFTLTGQKPRSHCQTLSCRAPH